MASSVTASGLRAGGLVSLGVGLERLLNAYLVGMQTADFSTRFFIGVLCGAIGVLLVALASPWGQKTRSDNSK